MPITGDFDFIHAKTHGLRSRVYELDRLDDLCDLRTVPQLWHRLYPDAEPAGHHGLQRRLLADHINVLTTVRQHLPEHLATFFTALIRRFQVENLKVLLRAWKAGEPFERVAPFLAPLPADLVLPGRASLKATSLADFLLLVPEPRFRAAGERAAAHFIESQETFFVEAAFDAAYYTALLDEQQQLRGDDARAADRLVRSEVAVHNILCLFRLKLNYALDYAAACRFFVPLAPHPFRLERLYDFPHFGDMMKLVPREFLPRDLGGELRTIADLERALWERLLHVANRQFYRSVGDFGVVVAFCTIKRVELANLIRVIEGVRYGLDANTIRQGLIRVPQRVAR